MYSPHIEEFQFCDRTEERCEIFSFLKNDLVDDDPNVLWIRGRRKAGTSRLLCEVSSSLGALGCRLLCKIDVNSNDDGGKAALQNLLNSFRRPRTLTFLEMATEQLPAVLSATNIPAALLASAIFLGIKTTSCSGREVPVYEILANCIKKECSQTDERLVVILDDFQHVYPHLRQCIVHVLSDLYYENDIRFIIATQIEDETDEIREDMLAGVRSRLLPVDGFEDPALFYALLAPYFHGISPNDGVVKNIFEACSGRAGVLRQHLVSFALDSKSGFSPNPNMFLNYIISNQDNPINELNNPLEKLAARCLRIIDTTITVTGIRRLCTNIAKSVFSLNADVVPFVSLQINDAISNLIKRQLLISQDDSLRIDSSYALERMSDVELPIAKSTFDFICSIDINEWGRYFPHASKDEVLARVSWEAEANRRIELNLVYAFSVAESFESERVLVPVRRLLSVNAIQDIDFGMRIIFAQACYNAGSYQYCKDLLSCGEISDIGRREEDLFSLYFLRGKAENALGKKEDAAVSLNQAIKVADDADSLVSAKSMLQLVYAEMPGKREEEKSLFDEIVEDARAAKSLTSSQCMALRTIVDFHGDYDDADVLLNRALEQSETCSDKMVRPCLLTAVALQKLRTDETEAACNLYEEAKDILRIVRPHEMAYLWSNIGTCNMIQGNYNEALNAFRQGVPWGATQFIQKVLYSEETICLGLLGRLDEALRRVAILESFLIEEDNPLMIERVGMSILFVLLITGATRCEEYDRNNLLFANYADLVRKNARKERLLNRLQEYERLRGSTASAIQQLANESDKTYYGAFFQPWAVTLHHD